MKNALLQSLLMICFVFFLNLDAVQAQDWNMLGAYDVSIAGAAQFGSETDGLYIYTTIMNSNNFAKFDIGGNWIETFSIEEVSNIKDLAFDGEYFYGGVGSYSNPIFILDFYTQQLIGNIPVPEGCIVNHISYDSDNDEFWVGDWTSDIYRLNRSGEVQNTIPLEIFEVENISGSAFDNLSEGGPYLWLHSTNFSGSSSAIVQISISTGSQTGIWHDAMIDAGSGIENTLAGGLFNSIDMKPGYFVIGGLIRGTPNMIFAYSLFQYAENPPTILSPENRSYGVSVLPLFEWASIENAVSYQIQVSTQINFSTTVINVENINDTSYQSSIPLNELTRYYWRVRCLNTQGTYGVWSTTYMFFTEGALPQTTLISPENGVIDILPVQLFSWTKNEAATNYHLQVSNTEDFSTIFLDEAELNSTSFLSEGLDLNTQYWWRVQMYNPANTSEWSEVWTFTTGSDIQIGFGTGYGGTSLYPTAYGNRYNGAKQQFLIKPEEIYESGGTQGYLTSLSFNVAMINSGAPLQNYQIKLKNVELTELDENWDLDGFTLVYDNESYIPVEGWNVHEFSEPFFWDGLSGILVDICFYNATRTQNESTYIAENNFYVTRYSRANNNSSICDEPSNVFTDNWRPNMKFSIEIPSLLPPFLVSPLNNSNCISTTPLLDWTDSEGALSYTLQISREPEFFTTIYEVPYISESSYQLPENILSELSLFYWRVNAEDGVNVSLWSNHRSFITEGNLPTPVLIAPYNNGLNLDPVQYFSWEPQFGSQNYRLEIATDINFNNILYDIATDSTSVLITELPLSSEIYWHISSQNECSISMYSETWSFVTSSIPFAYGFNNWEIDGLYVGPVTFSLNNPANMYQIQIQDYPYEPLGAGTWVDSIWYAVGYFYYDFYKLDPTTGDRTLIGNIGLDMAGISYDFQEDIMYGVGYNDGLYNLYTIDILTGNPTLIGNIGFNNFNNLACSLEGDLYSVGNDDDCLYLINKYTGVPTLIGPLGFDTGNYQDLEFEKTTNTCYFASQIDWSTGHLLIINTETGLATDVGMFPSGLHLTAMSIPFFPLCLDFPKLFEPINKIFCVPQTPVFDWNDVVGATSYTIQLAYDKAFTDLVMTIEGLTNSTYTVPETFPLNELTRYYWRILAIGDDDCNSYWSPKWSFVVEGDLPQTTLLNPPNEVSDYIIYPLFNWEENNYAEFYTLQVATDIGFTNLVVDQVGLTTNRFLSTELEFETQYWWRVMMINSCSESIWSDVWTFTTGSFISIGEGLEFYNQNTYPAPYGNSYNGAKHQILIRASELTDSGMYPGLLTSISFNVAILNTGTTLQDFSISLKHTTENEISEVWDFNDLTLVYGPIDYTPTLGWNSHTFENTFNWDGISNILIDICFNNISPYTNTLNESMFYTNTDYNSTRWIHYDGIENLCSNFIGLTNMIDSRPNILFGADIPRILPPSLISPANNGIGISTNPLFEWTSSEGALNYTLQVSTSYDFSSIIIEQVGYEMLSYQVTDNLFDELSTYYWRVNAANLEISSEWSEIWSFTTEENISNQNISLNSGWNTISSYIDPENAAITNIFENIVNDVKIVKNGAGQMYDPAFNINTIGNWNYEDGYLVNMLNSNELTITGTKLLPEETPMNLNNGWNLSAYLRDNEMSPTTALASISSSLVLAKNNVGGIYSPAFGINTLGNMQAGQGYYFYMNAPAMLTYPANSAQKSFAGDEITPLAKYNIPTIGNTGKNATLLISIENNEGNEIGVYNMNNELIGSGAVHNGIAAITIWGDDETTQNVDGAKESEYLKVKLYNTNDNTNKEISLSQIKEITSKTEQSELIYRTNAIFVAKASANDESGFAMSIKNIPNPVESNVVFEFSLTDDANAKIQIYTSTGELVASIGSGNYSAGLHRINFDASNLASGMYNIVLSSGSKKVSTFMVVDK